MNYVLETGFTPSERQTPLTCLVYVIAYKDLLYVGCTTSRLLERWRKHKCDAVSGYRNCHLQKALRTYPIEQFTIDVLSEYQTKDAMLQGEKVWMIALNTIYPNGLNENKHSTVNSGWHHTQVTKDRIRASKLGKQRPEPFRTKLLEILAARSKIPFSITTRQLLSDACRKRVWTQKSKDKVRDLKLGLKKINGRMVRVA